MSIQILKRVKIEKYSLIKKMQFHDQQDSQVEESFINQANYFKETSDRQIFAEFTTRFPNLPLYERYFQMPTLELITKIKNEVSNNDSELSCFCDELIRSMNVLNLKVFFQGCDKPIKELIRIKPDGTLDKKRGNNYISEKCSSENLIMDFNGEIFRTLAEELLIKDSSIFIEGTDMKQEVGISEKSTYKFVRTKTTVFDRVIILDKDYSRVNPKFILSNYTNASGELVFIFFTPEYSDGKFKRITVWYLSDNDNDMDNLIFRLSDTSLLHALCEEYREPQEYSLF